MRIPRFALLFLASALPALSAQIGIMVPAYIYPDASATGAWQKLIDAAGQVPLTVVFNPNSGPVPADGAGSALPGLYKGILGNLRAAGGKALGYIYTSGGNRSVAEVKADVDYYLADARYGAIDGFFLDEFPQGDLVAGTLSHYQEIYQYIKSLNPSYRVIGNPGTGEAAQDSYLNPASPSVDELVTFESNTGYTTDPNAGLPWKRQHGPGHFANIPWNVASADTMKSYVELAKSRNVGHIYVTDDDGVIPDSIYTNPWDTLPAYWLEEVQKVKDLNALETAPQLTVAKAAPGSATVTVSGSPGVTEIQVSSDLTNWTTLGVADSSAGNSTGDPGSVSSPQRFYRPAP